MISTMEMHTLRRILELEPELRRGWTYPEGDQGLDLEALGEAARCRSRWWGCATACPGLAAEKLPKFGVAAMWVYHPLVSPRLARICKLAGVELIAWTVDDEPRMRKLVDAGVNGLCSNDPRLFDRPSSDHRCGKAERDQTVPGVASGALRPPFFILTADSSSSWVKPPTASPSSA